ncbi:hypothetical protein VCR17J2_350166 [Vibrio coralliirubri]|nr:hypothetical protein VCR17J2_350166 [Vibrio coralliirubri]
MNLIRRKKVETCPAEFRDEDSALFISFIGIRKERLFTSILFYSTYLNNK